MKTFEELLNTLFEAHLKTVAEQYSDDSLYSRMQEHLHNKYDKYLEKIASNEVMLSMFLKEWYNTEMRYWGNMNNDQKYSYFTPDPNMIEIDQMSSNIYCVALKKAMEGIAPDEKVSHQNAERIEKMKRLISGVHAANKELAQRLISESIVDSHYADGKTENMSLRMANALKYEKKE